MGIQPFENLRVDRHGVIGPESGLSAGGVGIVVAQPEVGRVVVDHRVHGAGRYAEEELRGPQFGEVAQVVAPVGLGDDRHAVALGFEQPSHDRSPEGRVVDVGIAREEDHVELIPSAFADLLDGCRQKHRFLKRGCFVRPFGGRFLFVLCFFRVRRPACQSCPIPPLPGRGRRPHRRPTWRAAP